MRVYLCLNARLFVVWTRVDLFVNARLVLTRVYFVFVERAFLFERAFIFLFDSTFICCSSSRGGT